VRCYLLVYPLNWCLLAPWCVSVAPCGILCVVSSYILLYRLVACNWLYLLACLVGRACSLLLSVVLSCLLLVVVLSCLEWPPPGPRGYLQVARYPTIRRGGDFSKRGERQTETHPRPHFYARGQKKCGFSAQTEVKQLRKRRKWVLWCDFG
jgi:hypothetical protein